jgi:hypothetical protein
MSGPMAAWEYCIDADLDEAGLNNLGRNGWELVGVVTTSSAVRCYLKRPGTDFRERVTLDQKQGVYQRVLGRTVDAAGKVIENVALDAVVDAPEVVG